MAGQIEKAGMADYIKALEPDGTLVDPYRAVAATLYQVRYDEVTEEQRKRGKQIAYGLIYS